MSKMISEEPEAPGTQPDADAAPERLGRLPNPVEECLAKADAAYAKGDLRAACAHLREAHLQIPKSVPILACLGNIQFQLGEFDQAFEVYQQACEIDPDNVDTLVRLATTALRCDRIEHFERSLGRALELQDNYAPARRLLADTNFEAGHYEAAADQYQRLLEVAPNDAEALLHLGNCRFNLGDFAAAQACFQRVLQITPENALAKENLQVVSQRLSESSRQLREQALEHIDAGRWQEGARVCALVMAQNPDDIPIQLLLARCFQEAGDRPTAELVYQRVLEIDPANEEAHTYLAAAQTAAAAPISTTKSTDHIRVSSPTPVESPLVSRVELVSYALNELDQKLLKYLNFQGGVFIEAGANDGVDQSNTLYFERHLNWRGLLVEPIPDLALRCARNRPNAIVECVALVGSNYPRATVDMRYCNLMSLVNGAMRSQEAEDEHIRKGCAVQAIRSYPITVTACTLSQLIDKHHLSQIDLLSLDVEGYEAEVLRGLDLDRHAPEFLLVEARFPEDINALLGPFYDKIAQLSHHDLLYRRKGTPMVALSSRPVSLESTKHKAVDSAPDSPRNARLAGSGCAPGGVREQAHLEDQQPSIVFLNTYYAAFLDNYYNLRPELRHSTYAQQHTALQATCFGDSDFYSAGLKLAGWKTQDLVVNCDSLQAAWARENRSQSSGLHIALEQVAAIKPDVVYLQDLSLATPDFLKALRAHTRLIIGQIASPVPSAAYLKGLDLVFTSFPHFVERFRRNGVAAYYQPLAFEPRVLEHLAEVPRDLAVTFVGGLSRVHGKGTQFLEQLAQLAPVEFWGYGAGSLPADSAIRSRHHGEVWGLDMFTLMRRSRITINRHIDVAENNANNMRLFEATGCGALLITDYKDNLNELFEIGKEVVAYRSPEECAYLIRYYLNHPDEAETIARAGQRRTLRDHTYALRMEQTATILARHLRRKAEQGTHQPVDYSKISYGHQPVNQDQVPHALCTGWQSESIPPKQRALVEAELSEMYRGSAPRVFQVMAQALQPLVRRGTTVLEVGCASGYYSEVLGYLLPAPIRYRGVDYSEPLIAMARDYYPGLPFDVADGKSLPYQDNSFEVVISSCVLLHVPNFVEHIAETTRVAGRFVVAHRTPVCRRRETQVRRKFAYDVPTVELRFNEAEFLAAFSRHGFCLEASYLLEENEAADEFDVTYVFSREPANARFAPKAAGPTAAENPRQNHPSGERLLAARLQELASELLQQPRRACDSEPDSVAEFRKTRLAWTFDYYFKPRLLEWAKWLETSRENTNFTYDLTPGNRAQLAAWVSIVANCSLKDAQRYIEELRADETLRLHLNRLTAASPDRLTSDLNQGYGRRLGWYALVRALRPKVVVETGVDKGLGSCVLAAAILKNRAEGCLGRYYGTDINPRAGWLFRSPYDQAGEILYGDSIASLQTLREPVDLFINDSDHSADYEAAEYECMEKRLAPNAVILGDNAHVTDKLYLFARRTGRQFLFFAEKPDQHWYAGAGIGAAWPRHGHPAGQEAAPPQQSRS